MNLSFRWLREMVPGLEEDVHALSDRLARYGAPVEGLTPLGEALGGIVVGRVEAVREHPNADRLSLCTVDAGGEPLQVVCGAPNVREGAFYPFAPVGATLPGGMKIRKAKIRGEASQGMLCSARELELGMDQAGILELPGSFEPGGRLIDQLPLDDVRLEIEVTANRPDLLSHYGVARELSPAGDAGIRLAAIPGADPTFEAVQTVERADHLAIELEDEVDCPEYLGAVVRGVRVGPSPAWLSARLRALGLRPVNNVVDATNFVLHELGQPLHAFDLGKIAEGRIRVRRARAGETMVTLDGERRELDEEILIIADAEVPVALAGVMGGAESEVGAETRDVLVECAYFDPRRVRAGRSRFGMSTDASYRFERGVDPRGLERALRRVLALIVATAGGAVEPRVVRAGPGLQSPPPVRLRPPRVGRVLGVELPLEEIIGYLEPLGFVPAGEVDGGIAFRVPGHRIHDVGREADLVEEIARRHGFDRFPEAGGPFRPSVVPDDPAARLEDRLRDVMVGRGFLEVRSVPLVPEEAGDVAVSNPISAPEGVLRGTLVSGLLRRVEHNFARGVRDLRFFEIGTVFFPPRADGEPPVERRRIALAMTGGRLPPHWSGEGGTFDLWDAKAMLEELLALTGASARTIPEDQDGNPWIEIGHELRSASETPGMAGLVRADRLDAPPWAGPVYVVEVQLPVAAAPREVEAVRPVPTQPPADRDLALLVPDAVPAERVEAAIWEGADEMLEAVRPFDVYTGEGVEHGYRSIAWTLRFRHPERTLRDSEVDDAVAGVLSRLEALGVRRR